MKKLPTMLFAAMYIMTMLVGKGFVLCQSPDGHLAFEPPHEQSHCSGSDGNHHESHEHNDHDGEMVYHDQNCKPCIDTSLEVVDFVKIEKNELEDQGIVANSPYILNKSSFKYVKNLSYIPPPPRLNPTHISIRTVVFLI